MLADVTFYFLSAMVLIFGLAVVLTANPIYSALSLALTMVGVAALFWSLGAYFVAGVQLVVYAGAVMVLFVMVLMLFDLGQERKAFTPGFFAGIAKLGAIGLLLGVVTYVIAGHAPESAAVASAALKTDLSGTREVATMLFTKYLFAFEAVSVLLLLVIVGAVALSRSKGGTHAS